MRRLLRFLLSHSLFAAVCAATLGLQTFVLLHTKPNWAVIWLLFFATLGSYNAYWLLSKYSFSSKKLAFLLRENISYILLCILSCVGFIIFSVDIPGFLPKALPAIVLTVIYSLPLWPINISTNFRRLGVFKSTILALTWTYSTIIFPLGSVEIMFFSQAVFLFIARFMFLMILCNIFDKRDAAADFDKNIHSLATDLPTVSLNNIILIFFALYIASGIMVRIVFSDYWQMAVFLLTALLLWFVYKGSQKKQSYVFYYFIVDGMMIVSALLSVAASVL